MPVSEHTFETLALVDPEGQWELHHGQPRKKPPMSIAHNRLTMRLTRQLLRQLDEDEYDVRTNLGRVRRAEETYYIPDVSVIPVAATTSLPTPPDALEVFREPLPLVVEIWSPSTGAYDIDAKIPEYQRRGDREIWRLHPYERTLLAWRRQDDGTYVVTDYRGGSVSVLSLPGVTIDLDALFA